MRQKESSFSEEKEAKRRLSPGSFTRRAERSRNAAPRQDIKVFCFFYAKKKEKLP
jgi:hypothetical protein